MSVTPSIILLAVNAGDIELTEDAPLVQDSLRSISAALLRPGASKDEVLTYKNWVLVDDDTWDDAATTLHSWVYRNPSQTVIYSFNALYLIRRIMGAFARRKLQVIPATLWSHNTSRTYSIESYLTADGQATALDIIKHLGLNHLPLYEPHKDPRQDIVYLIEICTRFGLINDYIDLNALIGPTELAPPSNIEKAVTPIKNKKSTKTLV